MAVLCGLTRAFVLGATGQIGCWSEGKDKGSTFWFCIPLPTTTTEEVVDTSLKADFGGKYALQDVVYGLKVLLVEDNRVNQIVGRRLLERIGCQVSLASNGKECLEMLENESFALIFMDCNMPILGKNNLSWRCKPCSRMWICRWVRSGS